VQKSGNCALDVDSGFGREAQHVYAAERAIGSLAHQRLDRARRLAIGRLPQCREQAIRFVHEKFPAVNTR
jgi:uncharacterized protein (DUF488 family)